MRGYKAQCELLYHLLSKLLDCCEASCSSLICEGVHLSISFVVKLMQVRGRVGLLGSRGRGQGAAAQECVLLVCGAQLWL